MNFLRKQLIELRRHRRVASNRLSTALLYGASVGCDVGVYGDPMIIERDHPVYGGNDRIRQLWPEMHDAAVPTATSAAMAYEELGMGHVRQPRGTRRGLRLGATGTGRLGPTTGRGSAMSGPVVADESARPGPMPPARIASRFTEPRCAVAPTAPATCQPACSTCSARCPAPGPGCWWPARTTTISCSGSPAPATESACSCVASSDAESAAERLPATVEIRCGSLLGATDSYDAVIALGGLDHLGSGDAPIDGWADAIAQLAGLVAPGGLLAITVRNGFGIDRFTSAAVG